MNPLVLNPGHERKILDAVVELVAILVVNLESVRNRTVLGFPYKHVFKPLLTGL
jgi:hypothetical protein